MEEQNSTQFSPIKQLFQDAWHLFLDKALRLLLLWVFTVGAALLGLLIAGVLFALLVLPRIAGNTSDPQALLGSLLSANIIGTAGLLLLVLIVFSMAVSIASNAAFILIFNESKEKSTWQLFIRGFNYVIPLLITGLLSGLLVVGGYFVFVIPGVIMSLFFMFVTYVVVLEGKQWIEAIKSSVGMVSQNFGAILGRIGVFILIYILIFGVLPAMVPDDSPSEPVLGMVLAILGTVWGWYSAAYVFMLYKQARQAYDEKKPVSMTWIWVIAIIGWTFIILAGYGISQYIRNNEGQITNLLNRTQNQEEEPEVIGYMLTENVFGQINGLRMQEQLAPLEQDQRLCAYATRRLKQLADFGGFDDYAGFIEDTADQTVWNSYFRDFQLVNTYSFMQPREENIADVAPTWAQGTGRENTILSPDYTHICLRADSDYLVAVVGQRK